MPNNDLFPTDVKIHVHVWSKDNEGESDIETEFDPNLEDMYPSMSKDPRDDGYFQFNGTDPSDGKLREMRIHFRDVRRLVKLLDDNPHLESGNY